MPKALFIAEKPSVAREFAKALHENMKSGDGFLESENAVVTWCVGHLVTMSYPEVYDPELKHWRMETLPFIPAQFRYEIIPAVAKQFGIVKSLLNRSDVETIYVCTDSGREGEYIYRLVAQMAGVKGKKEKRVWIDSQTEEEIQKGIREAKALSAYDNLAASAYLRAKEDYLMGINFSRLLTLKYGGTLSSCLNQERRTVISVGRVMTCVLGMVVRREREIRSFVKMPFYRIVLHAASGEAGKTLDAEWKVTEESAFYGTPFLYKENGFREKTKAEELIARLAAEPDPAVRVISNTSKKEKVNAPLLFNLAELQNACSKALKISPDETLKLTQELYEKKLVTYPRTDARVLSTAIAKEIGKNISGLKKIADVSGFAAEILENGSYKNIAKTKYTNDKQITDHYAIIPTGQGLQNLASLAPTARKVYEMIVRRFLAIFYPPAVYQKYQLELAVTGEHFFSGYKTLEEPGFMKVSGVYKNSGKKEDAEEEQDAADFAAVLKKLKKGMCLSAGSYEIKEGETSPPSRYNSGSLILAMENAGQLIEDEDLRAQIKGSGIGTSATRAEILKKLVSNRYLYLNGKTQIITPTLLGEAIFDTVECSIKPLLDPELTASWELGLTQVSDGTITPEMYMEKLDSFIRRRTDRVKQQNYSDYLRSAVSRDAASYSKQNGSRRGEKAGRASKEET